MLLCYRIRDQSTMQAPSCNTKQGGSDTRGNKVDASTHSRESTWVLLHLAGIINLCIPSAKELKCCTVLGQM